MIRLFALINSVPAVVLTPRQELNQEQGFLLENRTLGLDGRVLKGRTGGEIELLERMMNMNLNINDLAMLSKNLSARTYL